MELFKWLVFQNTVHYGPDNLTRNNTWSIIGILHAALSSIKPFQFAQAHDVSKQQVKDARTATVRKVLPKALRSRT